MYSVMDIRYVVVIMFPSTVDIVHVLRSMHFYMGLESDRYKIK